MVVFAITALEAKQLLALDEVLRDAFGDARVERQTVFLTEDELAAASAAAGQPVSRALVVRYVAQREGRIVGTAYVDVHRVRTLEETLCIVVGPDDRIARVEVLSFDEPPDYLPREGWYAQFEKRALDNELRLDRAIDAVTGATLTAEATTTAARRILATHRAIAGRKVAP